MDDTTTHDAIAQALETLEEANPEPTGGKWLERLTAQIAPYIKEWDISHCWTWAEWPDRERLLPETTSQDNGIDAVAVNRSSGAYIAIQCKSRRLGENRRGDDIERPEITSFISESENELYAERWLITNGDNRLNGNAERTNSQLSKKVKLINLHADLAAQAQGNIRDEECPHCLPNPDGEWRRQSRTCMQNDAVSTVVSRLRGQLETDLDGIPIGQARGKIILPCGTGKTRISLRIVEELSPPGGMSVVLCPSIALVAQIRREYLLNSERPIRALAVCSDETAGYNPKKEGQRNTFEEVTADSSNVSANEIKGRVTTDPEEIARWIGEGKGDERVSVIFGTYQSGHRIAEALRTSGTTAEVLVCDEAHRTAGLRRTKKSTVDQIKDFTLCHDNGMFPAKHRIYQTATPKIYTQKALREKQKEDWVVRNMDDQSVFGPDLFRRSYRDAVNNGWLSDYRIIAVGISGAESHEVANALASATESKGRNPLTSTHFLRGLAFTLAIGGATKGPEDEEINIQSCIAFMNTVDKSDNMVKALDTEPVRNWLRDRMREMDIRRAPAVYKLDHLDASSKVTQREEAKASLAEGTLENPYGVINVGIFGEGTDSPSLSAVAFLEARRSPIDVVQAVGRAMRTSPGKDKGYVICPIVIPLDADAENFLKTSNPQDGWKELGDILLALRAHDERIEDRLAELMTLYLPPEPEVVKTILGIAHEETKRMSYWEHVGKPGTAELALQEVLDGTKGASDVFTKVSVVPEPKAIMEAGAEYQTATTDRPIEPSQSLSGKTKDNGETELRMGGVERRKPDEKTGMPGKVDIDRTKLRIKHMAEGKSGAVVTPSRERRPRRTQDEINAQAAMRLMALDANEERSKLITMNLLEKSGLRGNRPERDANMIQDSIHEAAHQLRNDSLKEPLDRHFNLNYLEDKARENQADGCTIAALLMMNAAMLHQRISAGRWLDGVESLDIIKNSNNPVSEIKDQWNTIRARDFRPVIEPALEAIRAVERTGRTGGLVRAVRHIAKEAEELAASYADLGADHAGPLFNRVMGNQASDGAYFTRPVAASIAARLTLDSLEEQDWTEEETWKAHKTVDLACGSGTLLTAILTEMKRRARKQGATASEIARLQKMAVEDTLKGMDINPISLQLAASQLTIGNQDIGYRRMGLHRMPYGPDASDPTKVSVGTLELLGQREIVPRSGELDLPDTRIASEEVWTQGGEAMEDALDAVRSGVRIVIMNPPFTNRAKMGEKFSKEAQESMRKRTDNFEAWATANNPKFKKFGSRNSVAPNFVMLADFCLKDDIGTLTMINPTIALTGPSGLDERLTLAERFYIHSVLTCHQPSNINMSQETSINESIIVLKRHDGSEPPTRFINLDRLPVDDDEVEEFHECLAYCAEGAITNGWGEVSYWPAERIAAGDWTPAIWRSPELAQAAYAYASREDMHRIDQDDIYQAGRRVSEFCTEAVGTERDAFALLHSKGADGQTKITAVPDSCYKPQDPISEKCLQGVRNLKDRAGHLLITDGQRNATARLTAVASDTKYVGVSWMPVAGYSPVESKAIAVFLNSTPGRLQLMRNAGRTIEFPMYRPAGYANIRIPDVKDARIRLILANCWERTKDIPVPQFRDGECEVRRLWDEALAEAMGWDAEELARLRHLLHQEPHVRGLGYGQYADEVEIEPADRERFRELADRWQEETIFLSNSERKNAHPAHQEIISLGQPVVPLILERMRSEGGHWFEALQQITGADPVSPADYGNIAAMQNSWLQWGEDHGYA